MHLICVAEALPQTYPKFIQWLESQSCGHGRPLVREIKILDINVKEQDLNYFAALLRRNVGFYEDYSRHGLPKKKLERIAKILRKILPLEDHNIQIDEKLVEVLPKSFGLAFGEWLYLYPIGKLRDKFDKHGVEIL